MEDINHADYAHAKRVYKDFKRKNLGECHDFYAKSDTLLSVDVFENLWKYMNLIAQNFFQFLD